MTPEDRAYENLHDGPPLQYPPEVYGLSAREAIRYCAEPQSDASFCAAQTHAIAWPRKAWRLALQREAQEDARRRNDARRIEDYATGRLR